MNKDGYFSDANSCDEVFTRELNDEEVIICSGASYYNRPNGASYLVAVGSIIALGVSLVCLIGFLANHSVSYLIFCIAIALAAITALVMYFSPPFVYYAMTTDRLMLRKDKPDGKLKEFLVDKIQDVKPSGSGNVGNVYVYIKDENECGEKNKRIVINHIKNYEKVSGLILDVVKGSAAIAVNKEEWLEDVAQKIDKDFHETDIAKTILSKELLDGENFVWTGSKPSDNPVERVIWAIVGLVIFVLFLVSAIMLGYGFLTVITVFGGIIFLYVFLKTLRSLFMEYYAVTNMRVIAQRGKKVYADYLDNIQSVSVIYTVCLKFFRVNEHPEKTSLWYKLCAIKDDPDFMSVRNPNYVCEVILTQRDKYMESKKEKDDSKA